MKKGKLVNYLTKVFGLLQLNKESNFSDKLNQLSEQIDNKIKDDEELQDLFRDYKAYLVAHVYEIKADNFDKTFINAIINAEQIVEDEE